MTVCLDNYKTRQDDLLSSVLHDIKVKFTEASKHSTTKE